MTVTHCFQLIDRKASRGLLDIHTSRGYLSNFCRFIRSFNVVLSYLKLFILKNTLQFKVF